MTQFATTAVELINAERHSQFSVRGYDTQHDLEHEPSDLAAAGICYAIASDGPRLDPAGDSVLMLYPWDLDQFGATGDPIGNLIKAGALIAAEIDTRLDRGDAICPKCRHQYHLKPCLNMASDNDCSCASSLS